MNQVSGEGTAGPSSGGPAPGWYVDPAGATRWWDGANWSAHVAPGGQGAGVADQAWGPDPAADRSTALIVHLVTLVGGIIGVGIMYAVTRERSQFVRHHVSEALNFVLCILIVSLVVPLVLIAAVFGGLALFGEAGVAAFALFFPVIILAWIVQVVPPILAMMAANRGEWYRYPYIYRFVSGPVPTTDAT
jgi:uncharacterized Tic20 family protein